MKRGWLASLLGAAILLPIAANGADDTTAPAPTPAVKAPDGTSNPSATKPTKGRLPPYYAKLPVDAPQREKIYEIEASFAPKIKALHEQLAALEADQSQQIHAVLTPEQQDKLKALIAESKKHHGKTPADTSTKPAPTDKTTAPISTTTVPTPVPAPK